MPYSYFTNHHLYNFDQLLAHLGVRPGHSVIDLGCGHSGFWTFPLADIVGRTGEIHAIDIDSGALNNIKRKSAELKLTQINAVHADLENLKKHSIPKADIAVLINTMYQLKKKPSFFTSIKDLLKPQGKLLVVDWKMNINPYGPPNESRVKEEDIQKWAKRAKLEILKELFLDEDHFAKILIKA